MVGWYLVDKHIILFASDPRLNAIKNFATLFGVYCKDEKIKKIHLAINYLVSFDEWFIMLEKDFLSILNNIVVILNRRTILQKLHFTRI